MLTCPLVMQEMSMSESTPPPSPNPGPTWGQLTINGHFLDSRYIRGYVCREREKKEKREEKGDKQQYSMRTCHSVLELR